MGKILVTGIKIYTNHGCLDEEKKIGSEYRVDIEIDADLKKSAETDELSDTVDYVHLNKIAIEEMGIRSKLLEQVAQRMIDRVFNEIPMVEYVKISVAKINPPIGGNVQEVVIVLEEKRKN